MRAFVLSNFVLALALLIGAPVVLAQSSDEAAVAQAVEAFRKAVIAKDRKQLEALIADQLVYGHSDGRTDTKASYLDDVASPRAVYKFIDLTHQTIVMAGNNAIVRHNFTGESERAEGKIQATKIGVLTVWQKQDGRWKLLARQSYPYRI
jgi:ketosteroid isomerase-like protein